MTGAQLERGGRPRLRQALALSASMNLRRTDDMVIVTSTMAPPILRWIVSRIDEDEQERSRHAGVQPQSWSDAAAKVVSAAELAA